MFVEKGNGSAEEEGSCYTRRRSGRIIALVIKTCVHPSHSWRLCVEDSKRPRPPPLKGTFCATFQSEKDVLIISADCRGRHPRTRTQDPSGALQSRKKKGVRLSVFEACAMQIKTIYEKAILRYPNHTTQDRVSDLLQPVIQKLEQRLSYPGQTRLITADECAGVARSAWLFWFTIIVSKKEERKKKHIGFNAL